MDEPTNNVVTTDSIDSSVTNAAGQVTPKPVAKVRSPYLIYGLIVGFMPRIKNLDGIEFILLVVLAFAAIGQSQRYYAVLSAPRRRGFVRVLIFAIVTSITLVILSVQF